MCELSNDYLAGGQTLFAMPNPCVIISDSLNCSNLASKLHGCPSHLVCVLQTVSPWVLGRSRGTGLVPLSYLRNKAR